MEFSQCHPDSLHLLERRSWVCYVTDTTGNFPVAIDCYLPYYGIDGVMYAGPIADAAAFVLAIVFARRELAKMRGAEA